MPKQLLTASPRVSAAAVVGSGMFISIAAQLLTARLLGAEVFGRYMFVIGLASTVGLAFKIGHDFAVTKYLSIEGLSGSKFTSTLLFIVKRTALLAIAGVPVFLVASAIGGRTTWLEGAVSLIVVLVSGLSLVLRNTLVAARKLIQGFLVESHLRNWLFLSILLALTAAGLRADTLTVVMAFSGSMAISTVILGCLVWRMLPTNQNSLGEEKKKEISKFAWSLGANSVVSALWSRADIILAAWLISDWKLVGALAVASRLKALAGSIDGILDPIFAPWIAREFANTGWAKVGLISRKYNLVAVGWATSAFLFILFLGRPIFSYLGNDYAGGRDFLLIFLGAQLIKALFGPVHLLLSMTNLERISLSASIMAFLIFLVLATGAGYLYGIHGVVWGIAFGIVIRPVMQLILLSRHRSSQLANFHGGQDSR